MRRAFVLALLLGLAACAGPSGAEPAASANPPATSAATATNAATQKFVVFFQSWSIELSPAASATIKTAASAANANPSEPVNVTGYADPTGGKEVNLLLSEARAQIVVDQLVADGVAASRIHRHAVGIVGFALTSQESRRTVVALGGS